MFLCMSWHFVATYIAKGSQYMFPNIKSLTRNYPGYSFTVSEELYSGCSLPFTKLYGDSYSLFFMWL